MRAVVQRVSRARVTVDGSVTGEIAMGLLILVDVGREDTSAVAASLAEKISNLRLEDWFVPVLFQEKDDPQLFRGAPPSKQTVEDFQAALATRLGELPPGSTGLFHLVIVYHPGQNGATYLRANNNNAAPQFSPSEASTDYRIKIDPITRLLRESNTRSRS
jgi:D-Tyr-tRNA(Tyr) deacylase